MKSPILKVESFFKKFNIKNKSILCAVSGGSDSVFLLSALNSVKEKCSLKLHAAHVDHGLRGEEGDLEFLHVKKLCEIYGVKLEFKKLSGKKSGDPGIEEWAREERYNFFNEIKEKNDIEFIATGHTMDDQAETLFMRIGRGSGVKALSGIKAIREDGVIRPILDISKEEIVNYLNDNSIRWCEDSSNKDSVFTRNRIRNKLFPLIEEVYPDFRKRLFYLSQQINDMQEIIDPPVSLWCIAHIGEHDNREFKISKPLDLQNRLIASEGMANIFREYGITVDRLHIDEFLDNSGRASGEFLLPGGWRYYPGKEAVHITCKNSEETVLSKSLLNIPGETLVGKKWMVSIKEIAFQDAVKIQNKKSMSAAINAEFVEALYIRTLKESDQFVPFGESKMKNVFKYLKKQGFNEHERRNSIALFDEKDRVVWVPAVSVSEEFRVNKNSPKLLKLEVQVS